MQALTAMQYYIASEFFGLLGDDEGVRYLSAMIEGIRIGRRERERSEDGKQQDS